MILDGYSRKEEYTKRHNDYIKCTTNVNAKKLFKSVYMPDNFPWGKDSFTVTEVKNAILSIPDLKECDSFNYEDETGRDLRHIERVLYFIRHPDKIDPINVEINVYHEVNADDFVYTVEDGWHRLYAAIILDIDIPCKFEGGKLFLKSIQ